MPIKKSNAAAVLVASAALLGDGMAIANAADGTSSTPSSGTSSVPSNDDRRGGREGGPGGPSAPAPGSGNQPGTTNS